MNAITEYETEKAKGYAIGIEQGAGAHALNPHQEGTALWYGWRNGHIDGAKEHMAQAAKAAVEATKP